MKPEPILSPVRIVQEGLGENELESGHAVFLDCHERRVDALAKEARDEEEENRGNDGGGNSGPEMPLVLQRHFGDTPNSAGPRKFGVSDADPLASTFAGGL